MTKPFTKLYSDFWINPDNAELMQLGIDAKLMAIYLQGNPHHNMLGVYYLPILYAASDLKQSIKKIQSALKKLCELSYCKYDEKAQYIWVCNVAREQLGEDVDAKDNRIKTIQAIWDSLPIKIEFLPEVYNKYHNAFNLKSRFFNSSCNKAKSSLLAEKLVNNTKTYQDTDISVGTIDFNLDKEPSVDYHHKSTFPTINLTSTFEGAFKPLQSPPIFIVENRYNFNKTNTPTLFSKKEDTTQKIYLSVTNCSGLVNSTQSLVDISSFETPSKVLIHPFDTHYEGFADPLSTPSEGLAVPFETTSRGLTNHSETPSSPLRVEYRNKNIENINNKKEKDLKKIEEEKEEKENKKTNNVLFSNSDPQIKNKTFDSFSSKPIKKNNSFAETAKPEEVEKTGAVDTKKQVMAYKPYNFPVVVKSSELKTNPAPVFSVLPVASVSVITSASSVSSIPTTMPVTPVCNNPNGSVINISHATEIIFEYWKKIMGYPEAELDDDRKYWIRKALRKNSIEKLCKAIVGCSLTPFNMGENEQSEYYNDLHVIYKNNAQIERFIRHFHDPPRPKTKAEKLSNKNSQVIREWSKSKNNELEECTFFRSEHV